MSSYQQVLNDAAAQAAAANRAAIGKQRQIQQAAIDLERARATGGTQQQVHAAQQLRQAINVDIRSRGGRPEDLRYTGYVHQVPQTLHLPMGPPATLTSPPQPQVIVIQEEKKGLVDVIKSIFGG